VVALGEKIVPDINVLQSRQWQYSNNHGLIFQVPGLQLSGGGVSASFGGYHASAGLGGSLDGGPAGGLFAQAGTPDGTSASAGLAGSVGSGGLLNSQAQLGSAGDSTAMFPAGTENRGSPMKHRTDLYDNVFNVSGSWCCNVYTLKLYAYLSDTKVYPKYSGLPT
jgi:hypothetical protein